MEIYIHSMWVYPVKSFKGYEVNAAALTTKGIKGDRQWMVIKPNNRMLTQRQAPQMANVAAIIDNDTLILKHIKNNRIISEITVPQALSDNNVNVKVHKDTCTGSLAPTAINQWITTQLNWSEPLRLVKFADNSQRKALKPERFGQNATYFADAAPYLIANVDSIDALNNHTHNDKTAYEATIAHFRPNIVLGGAPAFMEHKMSAINIETKHQTIKFELIDSCQRCVMITVNPQTGKFTHSMSVFNELVHINPMPDNAKAPAFGVNAKLINTPNGAIMTKDSKVTAHFDEEKQHQKPPNKDR